MPLITEELSVWDIGLRWAGQDPDRLWLRLPLAAKDNFRLLMEAILSGEIICNTLTLAKLPPGSKADPRFYIRTYIDEVYECIHGQHYDRKLLKWASLDRMDFHEWCERRGITPPEFWFPPGWKLRYDEEQFGHPGLWVSHVEPENDSSLVHLAYEKHYTDADRERDEKALHADNASPSDNQSPADIPSSSSTDTTPHTKNESALKDCQRIKLACQQIATVIWQQDGSRTIASVVKDDLIQKYGGANFYQEETVREWLKQVAPRDVKNRRGRPRKNGDSGSQE